MEGISETAKSKICRYVLQPRSEVTSISTHQICKKNYDLNELLEAVSLLTLNKAIVMVDHLPTSYVFLT